jgi:hypothetical protein
MNADGSNIVNLTNTLRIFENWASWGGGAEGGPLAEARRRSRPAARKLFPRPMRALSAALGKLVVP